MKVLATFPQGVDRPAVCTLEEMLAQSPYFYKQCIYYTKHKAIPGSGWYTLAGLLACGYSFDSTRLGEGGTGLLSRRVSG